MRFLKDGAIREKLCFNQAVREDPKMRSQLTESKHRRRAVSQRDGSGGDLELEETLAGFRRLTQLVRGRVDEKASLRAEADRQGEAQPLQI